MNYAEAIKALRKKMLITQTELATIIGVAFVSVNRWENGAYEPTMKAKRKLAQLFSKYDICLEE
jgi:DNA-binding XRE family transcriptional regulator